MNNSTPFPRILVTGCYGQLSWELRRSLQCLGDVVALGCKDLDLFDTAAIRTVVRELKPQLIVNAAAYTAVDKAESEPDLARALNATAPAVLAESALAVGAMLLHYSTDYVFDGKSQRPYQESDETNPQSVYGQSKLDGELAIIDSGVQHLILRTSWVYGMRGNNFLLSILRLAREREEIRVVDDQIGAPTWSRSVAEATSQILNQHFAPGQIGTEAGGDDLRLNKIYNLTAGGRTSWYGFARTFIDLAIEHGEVMALQRLVPITTAEYPTRAIRPAFSLLCCDRLADAYGVRLPDWRTSLDLVMEAA